MRDFDYHLDYFNHVFLISLTTGLNFLMKGHFHYFKNLHTRFLDSSYMIDLKIYKNFFWVRKFIYEQIKLALSTLVT